MLLSSDGEVKLSDFGLGALPESGLENGMLQTTCGTPNYVAPEVLARKGYAGGPADIWSLGDLCQRPPHCRALKGSCCMSLPCWPPCLIFWPQLYLTWHSGSLEQPSSWNASAGVCLFVITAGALPFDEPNLGLLFKKIQKADYQTPAWFSKELAHLLHAIITPDPKDRQGTLLAVPKHLPLIAAGLLWHCNNCAAAVGADRPGNTGQVICRAITVPCFTAH